MSKGGVILRTNQAWCDMLRITREQAIGQTANDIVKADDLPVFHSSTAELQERGETTCSVRFNTATPKDIWVEVLARRGADGLVLIAAHDITARRELEAEREEIANVSALLNAHLEHLDVAIFAIRRAVCCRCDSPNPAPHRSKPSPTRSP